MVQNDLENADNRWHTQFVNNNQGGKYFDLIINVIFKKPIRHLYQFKLLVIMQRCLKCVVPFILNIHLDKSKGDSDNRNSGLFKVTWSLLQAY